MNLFRKVYLCILKKRNPIKFARKIGVKVGDNCKFYNPKFSSEPYLIEIGNHVEITSGVTFLTHDGSTWLFRDDYIPVEKELIKVDRIIIKDNVFIGMNSTILPGISIGPNSIVGTCSVVTKDVPPNCVVAGNPAKLICSVDDFKNKLINNTPKWNVENFHRNQKEEILRYMREKYGI